VGENDGLVLGIGVCFADGALEGLRVEGFKVGDLVVGDKDGILEGTTEGFLVGAAEGFIDGSLLGTTLGL